jgi:hypothetical protein
MTDPSRPDRIIEDWSAVAAEGRRPAAGPRPVVVRSRLQGPTLAGLSVAAVAIVVAVLWLGGRGPNGIAGVPPTASASATPDVTSTPSASPGASVTTTGECTPDEVDAVITKWEGAAGNRIADVELTNIGQRRCTVHSLSRPQLVDGKGGVLIKGSDPTTFKLLAMEPGDVLRTLVDASNYCGSSPRPPVTVDFVQDNALIVATALTPTDTTLPPCNGPGQPGSIQMQPWGPQR